MTQESTQNAIAAAKAQLAYTRQRAEHLLACTPDDRINWSPSPTARTPIEVVAHIAMGLTGVQLMLEGKPRLIGEFGLTDPVELSGLAGEVAYPFATVPDIDIAFRQEEKKFTTREDVLALLERTASEFYRWLDTLTPEQMDSTLDTFFGPVPMTFGITIPAMHNNVHIGQLEYIQTIYGDMDRHP